MVSARLRDAGRKETQAMKKTGVLGAGKDGCWDHPGDGTERV